MTLSCWICNAPVGDHEARVLPKHLPHRLRRYREQPVHLRCFDPRDKAMATARVAKAPGPRDLRPTHALGSGALFFAEDLATIRGISRSTAWRWLVRLEDEFGEAAVGRLRGRRGPRRFVRADALASIALPASPLPCGA